MKRRVVGTGRSTLFGHQPGLPVILAKIGAVSPLAFAAAETLVKANSVTLRVFAGRVGRRWQSQRRNPTTSALSFALETA